jgi:putative RNA 2'-phosphotransferase
MSKNLVKQSKFLSLVLRHQPETIGITLDEQGWVDVETLLAQAKVHGRSLSRELLEQIVAENDKQRFAFSPDGLRIRANQGHSVEVDLALLPTEPPEFLYHGTASHNVESIRRSGLHSGNRQHVHLSKDIETAVKVGQRHGVPVVLTVRANEMHSAGHKFYLAQNGVWLADAVPIEFLTFPDAVS